jgi:hypothetical protein
VRLADGPLGVRSFRLLAGGPSLFFPVAAGLLAVAILWGLTQREFREFGARTQEEADGAGTPAAKREERAVR